MRLADPILPPLLTGHAVKAPEKPFDFACRGAGAGRLGAADLVWGRGLDTADLALVLEPDVAREAALAMLPLAEVALGDCLGVLCPPQVGVTYHWPGIILVNGAEAGRTRLAMAESKANQLPAWLVVGATIRIRHDARAGEPGDRPGETSLAEEGAGDIDRSRIIESFASHFLTWLDIWQDDGFRPVHEAWLARAEGRGGTVAVTHMGVARTGRLMGLDEHGNLLLKAAHGPAVTLLLADRCEIVQPSGAGHA
jgi:biotin-(acetyl-CoA carboxylase) ligase